MNHQRDEPRSAHGPCPSRDALSGFVLGKLSPQSIEAIGRHIETCSICQKVLDTLDALEDSVIANLKEPVHPQPADPAFEEQIRRAEDISQIVWQRLKTDEPEESLPARLGQYEILERIGCGGMGTVYKAMHIRLKRPVALKLLPKDRTQDHEALGRFQREMEAIGRLDHPHLVRAHDAGETEGRHYLVMEFLDGIDLARHVRRHGPLPVADACEIVRQAALGVQHAHEHNLVHRDVKPSNLMLTEDGQIKVLDLGLARLNEEVGPGQEDATATGHIFGTGDFIAPEQGQDARQADARSDVYSLGCTLYFLLAGYAPFSGPEWSTFMKKVMAHSREPIPSIRSVRQDVPEGLAVLIDRMTAKDPAKRFQTAAELAQALEPWVNGSDLRYVATKGTARLPEAPESAHPGSSGTGLRLLGVLLLIALCASGSYWCRGTHWPLLGHPSSSLKPERLESHGARHSLSALHPVSDTTQSDRVVAKVHAETAIVQQEINRDFAELQQKLDRDLAELRQDVARDFGKRNDKPRETRKATVQHAAAQGARRSDGLPAKRETGSPR